MLKFYKISMGIEYDGSRYSGWQRQNRVNSIQENLEKAISKIANEKIKVFCAGRTDTGVHSTGQVIHFITKNIRQDIAWTLGVNTNLPRDIAVRWVKYVPDDFHARINAISRRYHYIIFNHKFRPALLNKKVTHCHKLLDTKCMQRAAECLIGENDFTSFRTKKCQSRTPWRNLMHININRSGVYVMIDIKANSFLHHMVRNIVGSLIEIGTGKKKEKWISELLAIKDRTHAAATAAAEGLYLVEVDYPKRFNLPKTSIRPIFLMNEFSQ